MTWWQAIILGIVQGLGEFLPISSSGHLVLFQNIFNVQENELIFDTLLHVGTLAAVFIVLWKDIWEILKHPFRKVTLFIIIATIPAVIAALFFDDFIESAFGGLYLGWGFLLTALVLFLTAATKEKNSDSSLDKITLFQASVMGIMQAFAILPGISRSGSTICGGLYAKGNRDAVTRFSFLMAIPAILGSVVFQIKDIIEVGTESTSMTGNIILGTLFAALTGILSLKIMIKLVKKGKLWVFGIYVLIIGSLVLIDQHFTHLVF
ncbi:MAG: undecaprenyl-diphosphate phosphatase [Clostridia bacterium]|nr:undecaprenyl-diphosphate phosphatase [Clostridia bacterium]